MNAKARQRAQVIFQVRSGQMSATEAARTLGISRQQYYQWEQRALQALLAALENRAQGRPKGKADPDKQSLQQRVNQLEKQVQDYEQKEKLHQLLKQWEERPARSPAKKNQK
jgi:transposase